jgi:prephenate dehydratase
MNAHPKLSIQTATQLAVFLANRPGALARVCDELAKAEIISMRWRLPTPSIIQLRVWS